MNIQFFDPISRGWTRMVTALFKPFDIGKWFVVGFTAFLAKLLDGGGGHGFTNVGKKGDFQDLIDFPHEAREWILDHPELFTLIVIGVIFIFALVIVLTWISSRGKFMFLDNVIHDRAKVTKPWHDYRTLGNSLFIWRLVFGLICLAVILLFVVVFFINVFDYYEGSFDPAEHIFSIIGMVLLLVMCIIVIAYISLFLDHFIVPIMYKNHLAATSAWNQFLTIFSKHWLYFLLYGLIIFMLYILIVLFILFAGLFTCCIGFLLLLIPYINSVVLLPISYWFRAFSVEFLEQFGPEFEIFPKPSETAIAETGN